MSPLAWLIVFFFVLLAICILVYVLVVRAFGDQDAAVLPADHRRRYMDAFHPSCSSCAAWYQRWNAGQ